jgi:hypothetical protein
MAKEKEEEKKSHQNPKLKKIFLFPTIQQSNRLAEEYLTTKGEIEKDFLMKL